jgi:MarR family transcriptional regulator, 2-MHQ and catechol-resistance regulon repressor
MNGSEKPPLLTGGAETQGALKLWIVLARAYRSVLDYARQDIEARGLGMTEFAVLEALFHKGPLPLGELSELVLLTSGSTTYVADKLEGRGLLSRRPCSDDRRVIRAELTEQGRALIESIFPAHAEALRRALSSLDEAEKRQAVSLLKRLGRGVPPHEPGHGV